MDSLPNLTAASWPGLLTVSMKVEEPLIASILGKPGKLRGGDPLPTLALESPKLESEPKKDWIPNPFDGAIENVVSGATERIEGLLKNTLIALAGLVILAIGLFAIVRR